ncbi:hypothetical protein DFJ74DRAFT_689229 [Hyaloraphidium curvatum]|nr:hypothetical protein DFJ74DRAFT_689229 [Hyaloraphidium curvatum]
MAVDPILVLLPPALGRLTDCTAGKVVVETASAVVVSTGLAVGATDSVDDPTKAGYAPGHPARGSNAAPVPGILEPSHPGCFEQGPAALEEGRRAGGARKHPGCALLQVKKRAAAAILGDAGGKAVRGGSDGDELAGSEVKHLPARFPVPKRPVRPCPLRAGTDRQFEAGRTNAASTSARPRRDQAFSTGHLSSH